MALFAIGVNTTLGADTISINFGRTTVATTSTGDVGGVEAAYWNNITGNDAGAVSKSWDLLSAGGVSYSGGITVNTTHSPWGPRGDQSTVLNAVQSSYLDCTNHTPTQWTLDLKVDDDGYAFVTKVSLYFSGDSNSKYGSINVGGIDYIGGAEADTKGSTAWGNRETEINKTIGDHNTLVVTDLAANAIIMNNPSTANRSSISGMQVEIAEGYVATLSGEMNASEVMWYDINGAATKIGDLAVGERYLSANVTGDRKSVV